MHLTACKVIGQDKTQAQSLSGSVQNVTAAGKRAVSGLKEPCLPTLEMFQYLQLCIPHCWGGIALTGNSTYSFIQLLSLIKVT